MVKISCMVSSIKFVSPFFFAIQAYIQWSLLWFFIRLSIVVFRFNFSSILCLWHSFKSTNQIVFNFLHVLKSSFFRWIFFFSYLKFLVDILIIFVINGFVDTQILFNFLFEKFWKALHIFFLKKQFCLFKVFKIWYENVFLEKSNFLGSITKYHDSKSILNSFFPITSIDVAINPEHFSIPMSLIINIGPFVFIST